METLSISTISFFLLFIIISCSSCQTSADGHDDFLECLSQEFKNYSSISSSVYTTANSSFTSVLDFSIRNQRFASESTPKPQVIITPEHESQIPPLIYCAKRSDLEIRIRSGGHDFEGLSYVSRVPFVIIDLINLSEITVDVEKKTAWVGGGATLGQLYYRIAEKSPTLGFPAGHIPTVGVGGHFSGGGYGNMLRKYGLAADHVIDTRIIDVNGRILDRESMGEDLFWAIRGGIGASFGVIVAWKVELVDVPETVTVFSMIRTLEQNATQLFQRWQYVAPQLDKDLFITVIFRKENSSQEGRNTTVQALFASLFLGRAEKLLPMMKESFPELGVVREDCFEISWIQSILYFAQLGTLPYVQKLPIEVLLNRTSPTALSFKIKSDYVKKPIPEDGVEDIVRLLHEAESKLAIIYMMPYGGRMAEIPESAIPFPHRAGNLFKLASVVGWQDDRSDKYISWIRRYYSSMTPYVSKSPREAYVNYRDLDIGMNNIRGNTSIEQASIWGKKYFKSNFDRLVRVKTAVDPHNFFKYEQSIPPLIRNKALCLGNCLMLCCWLLPILFMYRTYFLDPIWNGVKTTIKAPIHNLNIEG